MDSKEILALLETYHRLLLRELCLRESLDPEGAIPFLMQDWDGFFACETVKSLRLRDLLSQVKKSLKK